MHTLSLLWPLFPTLGVLAYSLYLRMLILKEFPTKREIMDAKREILELAGDINDLQDRFTRFQKREGMRSARAEKTAQEDLRAEAQRILAEQTNAPQGSYDGPLAGKMHLYRGH